MWFMDKYVLKLYSLWQMGVMPLIVLCELLQEGLHVLHGSCEVKKLENLSVLSHLKVILLSYNSSGLVQSYQSESPSA